MLPDLAKFFVLFFSSSGVAQRIGSRSQCTPLSVNKKELRNCRARNYLRRHMQMSKRLTEMVCEKKKIYGLENS
jgi:hypothetical protein